MTIKALHRFRRRTAAATGGDGVESAAERAVKLFGPPVDYVPSPPAPVLPPEKRMRRAAPERPVRRSRPLPVLVVVVPGMLLGAIAGLLLMSDDPKQLRAFPQALATAVGLPQVYLNCAHARVMGATPLRRGQPGYLRRLDEDGDGVACEPIVPPGSVKKLLKAAKKQAGAT